MGKLVKELKWKWYERMVKRCQNKVREADDLKTSLYWLWELDRYEAKLIRL